MDPWKIPNTHIYIPIYTLVIKRASKQQQQQWSITDMQTKQREKIWTTKCRLKKEKKKKKYTWNINGLKGLSTRYRHTHALFYMIHEKR